MSVYLDTSLLVAAVAREAATARTQAWLTAQEAGSLLISDWVVTEFASALSVKLRIGDLDTASRAEAAGLFARLRAEGLTELSVYRRHFHDAAAFATRSELGLRGADALHIAIAAGSGATICTLDRRLAEAARSLAVPAELI